MILDPHFLLPLCKFFVYRVGIDYNDADAFKMLRLHFSGMGLVIFHKS